MKYYKKDALLDIFYPARCPICGQNLRKSPTINHFPTIPELICKPCFFRLPFIHEAHCMICGRPLESPLAELCPDCRRYPHAFLEARAVFSYKGIVQKSLYQLKYGGCKEYSRFFAAAMAHYLLPWIRARKITAVVPIPLHKSRLRSRTYNQAGEIAVRLAEYLCLPVYTDLLIRQKETIAQKDLNRMQRMENLRDAFCINPALVFQMNDTGQKICHMPDDKRTYSIPANDQTLLANKHILLVDDIFTTGATTDVAASVLKAAGCHEVYVGAVAVTG